MKNRIYFKIYANNTYSICYYKDNSKNLFLDLHIKPYYSYKDKLKFIMKLKKT